MDNTGRYVSIAQILKAFADVALAQGEKVLLANKTVIGPGDETTFEITAPTLTPELLDYITQGTETQQITNVSGTTITVADGTNIENGEARLYKLENYTLDELNGFIDEAMSFIDRHTRQWFNARQATLRVFGWNAPLLHLYVPIISIDSILLNEDSPGSTLDPSVYRIHNSRTTPDDRRNPRILLVRQDFDIFNLEPRVFQAERTTKIVGTFGFLEEDGSTPLAIQRATLKLAVLRAINTPGLSAKKTASKEGLGAIKRERTDLHETEYFSPEESVQSNASQSAGVSGDSEVDSIIAAYRGPMIIGGITVDTIFSRQEEDRW